MSFACGKSRGRDGNAYRNVELAGHRLVVGHAVAGVALVSVLHHVELHVVVDIHRVHLVQDPVGPGWSTPASRKMRNEIALRVKGKKKKTATRHTIFHDSLEIKRLRFEFVLVSRRECDSVLAQLAESFTVAHHHPQLVSLEKLVQLLLPYHRVYIDGG